MTRVGSGRFNPVDGSLQQMGVYNMAVDSGWEFTTDGGLHRMAADNGWQFT